MPLRSAAARSLFVSFTVATTTITIPTITTTTPTGASTIITVLGKQQRQQRQGQGQARHVAQSSSSSLSSSLSSCSSCSCSLPFPIQRAVQHRSATSLFLMSSTEAESAESESAAADGGKVRTDRRSDQRAYGGGEAYRIWQELLNASSEEEEDRRRTHRHHCHRHRRNGVLLLDGGTGEELFRRGVPDDREIWSATAVVNAEHHGILRDVHRSFLRSGSMAVTTNSYGIVPGVGFTNDEIASHAATAARLAREVVDEEFENAIENANAATAARKNNHNDPPTPRRALVLGSLGPLVESYRADKIKSHDDGVAVYEVMVKAMEDDVDVFLAETMSGYEECIQVVDAVRNVGGRSSSRRKGGGGGGGGDDGEGGGEGGGEGDRRRRRITMMMMISFTLNDRGELRSGESVVSGMKRLLDYTQSSSSEDDNDGGGGGGGGEFPLMAIIFNCARPEDISQALKHIANDDALTGALKMRGILLGANANRLTTIASDWSLEGSDVPQSMRDDLNQERYLNEFVSPWIRDLRLQLVGGCCGVFPEDIAHLDRHI